MAYIQDPSEQEKQLQQQQVAQSGPSSAAAPSAKPANPTSSGSWTNLNSYLQNQGQINQTANALVGAPDTKSKEAQSAIEGAQKEYQSQLAQPVTAQQKTQLQNTLTQTNPNVQQAKDIISSIQNFQPKMQNVDTNKYQTQYEAAKAANEAKNRSVGEQLDQQYNGRGTSGMRSLDTFAVNATPEAKSMLDKAKADAVARQQGLDTLIGKNEQLRQQGITTQQQNKAWLDSMKTKAGTAEKSVIDAINREYAAKKSALDANIAAGNDFRNNVMMSEAQAKSLGLDWNKYQKLMKDQQWYDTTVKKPGYDTANKNALYASKAVNDYMTMKGIDLSSWDPFDPKNKTDPVDLISKQANIPRNEAQQMFDLLMNSSGANMKKKMATPYQDIPQYQNYVQQRGNVLSPTDPYAFATQPQTQQYNAINDIWGLGNKALTPNQNDYGYKVDTDAYAKALSDYLKSHYGN